MISLSRIGFTKLPRLSWLFTKSPVCTMPSIENKIFTRLPKNVKPLNYKLWVKTDLTNCTFRGTSQVLVDVLEPTSNVVLNSVDLAIENASFLTGTNELRAKVSFQESEDRAIFSFDNQLPVGKGSLKLEFQGVLNDKLRGFYRSKYVLPSGEQRYYAVTQFAATDARRAFPCWDEPAVKASFDVTLTAAEDRVILSNMPEKNVTIEDGMKTIEFETTPVMSTYLLAFAIGDFDHVEMKDENGVLVRTFTQVGKKEQGRFAMEVAAKALPFYKNYFNIGYPLPKMDLVAIPDFACGAMENWGLTTYRETALLVDPYNSAMSNKLRITLTVCHEMAHQWFGNLVTMEWWTHLWLNEGYATWIEYLCADSIFPEWKVWMTFLSSDHNRAMSLDALQSSHPVEVEVGHPSEIDEIFDAISYSKGASVIHMIYHYIGDAAFRQGMHDYLTRYQYSNAETQDLWRCLSKSSGKNIEDIMTTFTSQIGYAVVGIEPSSENCYKLTQEKFNANGERYQGDQTKLWKIPLTYFQPGEASKPSTFLLDSSEGSLELPGTSDFVKLNSKTSGYYRVNYSKSFLAELSKAVKNEGMLEPSDRFGLTSDLFALCRAGYGVSISELLDFFMNLSENEMELAVWEDISASHSAVATLIQHTKHSGAFKSYTKKLFGPLAAKLGWEAEAGESTNNKMLRPMALMKIGLAGDKETVDAAQLMFRNHCGTQGTQIPADLRATVYAIVAANGSEDSYAKMLEMYRKSDLNEEKIRLLRGMAQHEDLGIKRKYLQWAFGHEVKPCDAYHCLAAVITNPEGRELCWQFAKDNWSLLRQRYESAMFLFGRILSFVSDSLHGETFAEDVEQFFNANFVPCAKNAAAQSVERIRVQSGWLKRETAGLDKYFEK